MKLSFKVEYWEVTLTNLAVSRELTIGRLLSFETSGV